MCGLLRHRTTGTRVAGQKQCARTPGLASQPAVVALEGA
jgi:hypothetical protein